MLTGTNPIQIPRTKFQNARLFASREDLVRSLTGDMNTICEIGVGYGEFSKFLVNELKPKTFVALDIFLIHQHETCWGRPTSEVLKGQTHREYYERKMQGAVNQLIVREGLSNHTLQDFPDAYFDLIYVDADHDYDTVRNDAMNAYQKAKPGSVIIFNDYTMYDVSLRMPYGVVRAVNELVVANKCFVIGLSLDSKMFCDIAILKCAE